MASGGGFTVSLDGFIIGLICVFIALFFLIHITVPIYEITTIKVRYYHLKTISLFIDDINSVSLYARANEYIKQSKLNKINRNLLRQVIDNKPKAILIIEIFYIILCCLILLLGFRSAYKERKMLYLNPNILVPPQGIDGFIKIIKGFIDPALIEKIYKSPLPNVLYEVFTIVRKKTNIPPNWVARCFPKYSEERLRLLEWGKLKIIDREKYREIINNQINRQNEQIDNKIDNQEQTNNKIDSSTEKSSTLQQ